MKQLTIFLSILLAACIFTSHLTSCGNSVRHGKKQTVDTTCVMVCTYQQQFLLLPALRVRFDSTQIYLDSNTDKMNTRPIVDTQYYVWTVPDTIRDLKGKPVIDSISKKVKFSERGQVRLAKGLGFPKFIYDYQVNSIR